MKRVLAWIAIVATIGVVGLYGKLAYDTIGKSPLELIGCMEGSRFGAAWICKQVLARGALTPDAVRELNAEAGALYAASMTNPAEADQVLSLFLKHGVDINARDQRTEKKWTALHVSAMGTNTSEVKRLLEYGARLDLRDKDDLTALDLARRTQQKFANVPGYANMVRLLETAEHTPSPQQ